VPDKQISAAGFSQNGHLLVTGCSDGSAQVWSVDDGSLVRTLEGKGGQTLQIEFSRDDRRVIAGSRDGTVHIRRVDDGTEQLLKGHTGDIANAHFSPSGFYAVTASSIDRTVRLWEVASGREIAILSGEQRELTEGKRGPAKTYAAFSPDGTQIVALSGDNDVRLITAFETPQAVIDYARNAVPRELSMCERRHFFLPVEGEVKDCLN
jgi:WD40 repeat protein